MNRQDFSDEQLLIIAERLLHQISEKKSVNKQIPVGISNRHIHLCQQDIESLFGKGFNLVPKKYLSQPGQFASDQTVSVVGVKGSIHNVRVLGPERQESQLEISRTDSFQLGVHAPINESGNLTNAGSAFIVGPKGSIQLKENIIIAKRHIHMTPEDAKRFEVTQGQTVSVKTIGERATIFGETIIRISDDFSLECHLDMDEANAAGLSNKKAFVEITKEV
ncbi:phosphate propanoyltransferase [Enterococcus avium]|uniref:phosphate propanoyltransferase n=1 Tax=Enterococcus avium TaxID=33945 RepID=UPI00379DC675